MFHFPIAYSIIAYSDYIFATVVVSIMSYFVIYFRKRLILDEAKMKQQSKNWKDVLFFLTDAVVVCTETHLLFKNPAMDSLIKGSDSNGEALNLVQSLIESLYNRLMCL